MSASRKAFEALHKALADVLTERVKDGAATAADLNVARQFLKDNGVGLVLQPNQDEAQKLADVLPFKDTDAIAAEDGYSH